MYDEYQGGELLQLTYGCQAVVREPGVVQFGADATRMGLIEVTGATEVAAVLNALAEPAPRARIIEDLRDCGLGVMASSSLVADLVGYGILRPPAMASYLTILGDSVLAGRLRAMAQSDGFELRTPLGEESLGSYASSLDSDIPVVAVDSLADPVDTANALDGHGLTWLPVSLLDSRGFIGPLRRGEQGPCPLCAHLHRVDADPRWHHVSQQLAQTPGIADPAAIQAVAAQALIQIRKLAGRPLPPGASGATMLNGEVLEVDVYGRNQQRFLNEHRRCPVCFSGALQAISPLLRE
ncbi:TOMM precursor leader peptide-binding protein [Corynebacterium flavescens]|uniref:TOMM precursor leader peptide-binding protein n=1 Tax=Corynebacterium flavescens TaxID=28028 RepID=UPI000EC0C96C|nr:hypothetical protein [Corynebacterium flavescens]